jgi:hypothetical protein
MFGDISFLSFRCPDAVAHVLTPSGIFVFMLKLSFFGEFSHNIFGFSDSKSFQEKAGFLEIAADSAFFFLSVEDIGCFFGEGFIAKIAAFVELAALFC